MVRKVSYFKRTRVIELYLKHNLNIRKGRYHILKYFAAKEGIFASTKTFRRICERWRISGVVSDKESLTRSANTMKINEIELNELDQVIVANRETTALQAKNSLNLRASARTVQKYLNRLGWKRIITRFCQFVSTKNRIERVIFCNFCILTGEDFQYSIFIDECTVSMDKNGRFQWYRSGLAGETRSGLKSKYKHAASVHILGGISRSGRTKLMIFSGKLNTQGFQELATEFIIPFVHEVYPEYHRLHLDNASFHTKSSDWFNQNGLNHFKTPAQSPDLNPIELVWNDLKYFIGTFVKPNTIQELVQGIIRFWNEMVTRDYCNRKIDHLFRVIDTILSLNGKASGL